MPPKRASTRSSPKRQVSGTKQTTVQKRKPSATRRTSPRKTASARVTAARSAVTRTFHPLTSTQVSGVYQIDVLASSQFDKKVVLFSEHHTDFKPTACKDRQTGLPCVDQGCADYFTQVVEQMIDTVPQEKVDFYIELDIYSEDSWRKSFFENPDDNLSNTWQYFQSCYAVDKSACQKRWPNLRYHYADIRIDPRQEKLGLIYRFEPSVNAYVPNFVPVEFYTKLAELHTLLSSKGVTRTNIQYTASWEAFQKNPLSYVEAFYNISPPQKYWGKQLSTKESNKIWAEMQADNPELLKTVMEGFSPAFKYDPKLWSVAKDQKFAKQVYSHFSELQNILQTSVLISEQNATQFISAFLNSARMQGQFSAITDQTIVQKIKQYISTKFVQRVQKLTENKIANFAGDMTLLKNWSQGQVNFPPMYTASYATETMRAEYVLNHIVISAYKNIKSLTKVSKLTGSISQYLMDAYLLARAFRQFDGKFQRHVIVLAGEAHIKLYIDFLKTQLGFDHKQYPEERECNMQEGSCGVFGDDRYCVQLPSSDPLNFAVRTV